MTGVEAEEALVEVVEGAAALASVIGEEIISMKGNEEISEILSHSSTLINLLSLS